MSKTKRDWLQAGLEIMAQDGARALTIEKLTSGLAVTKGSFYHHFSSFADYKSALLQFFEDEATSHIIELTEQQRTPVDKLRFLLNLTTTGSPDLEIAIRAWSLQDEQVRTLQVRIDARRIEYVRSLCRHIAPDEENALLMAQFAYVILVGSSQLQPPLSPTVLRQLFAEYLRLYQIND